MGRPALVAADGRTHRLQYRKGWALLAWLVLQPAQRHSRVRLAELLWPKLREQAALVNLRQVLCDLNQVLAALGVGAALECDRVSVCWRPQSALRVDALCIAASVEVFANDGGMVDELLDGVCVGDCTEFNQWLGTARLRLARDRERSLERLRDELARTDRIEEALDIAHRLVERDPWSEERCRGLMRVLALAGEYARAMDVYDDMARCLRSELGVEPGPESRAKYLGIRASGLAREMRLQDRALGRMAG